MRSCALLVALFVSTLAPSYGRRVLKEEGSSSCNATRDSWNWDSCMVSIEEDGSVFASNTTPMMSSVPTSTPMPSVLPAPAAPGGGASASGIGFQTGEALVLSDAFKTPATEGIGFQAGGAMDIANFRENIKEGYLPLPTDVTFEGVIRDYYFDTTGVNYTPCKDLFCPVYSAGASVDPLLGDKATENEIYLAVGLDSGLTAEQARRKRLNLVLLLDISGSMGSPFDAYYYDQFGNQKQLTPEEASVQKIDVAKEVLNGILGLLNFDDQVGIVLFTDYACAPKELGPVSCIDMDKLMIDIDSDVDDTGGTNMQVGYDMATNMLKNCRACMESSLTDVENRIILITDAQPNSGDTSSEGLTARLKANTVDGIFTTMIGVGLDFNTELVEEITKVKGANYFSVHTPGEFKKRLVDEFDYAVTPLVFDLELKVDESSLAGGDGWKILHVYGNPTSNTSALNSDGSIMKINTLFPSPKTEEGVKGGVVLLRMKPPTAANTPLQLAVTYTDRAGVTSKSNRTVDLANVTTVVDGGNYFSTGVEKAVVLARYVNLLQTWLLDQWARVKSENEPELIIIPPIDCTFFPSYYCPIPVSTYGQQEVTDGCVLDWWLLPDGCILPPPIDIFPPLLGRWERQSEKLAVNPKAAVAMSKFIPYLETAMAELNDTTLAQEVEVLQLLLES